MTDSVAGGRELLGWVLIPVGCSSGGVMISLTTHLGAVMKRDWNFG
jgi:hypothetical protein